jgi:hypothetical protein
MDGANREKMRERNAAIQLSTRFSPRYNQGVCMPVRMHIRSNEWKRTTAFKKEREKEEI